MHITRIQIEGGFLDGFDLKPVQGLNVLIGARGTGKTSVIELIRYALGAKSHTAESQARSLEHAQAVLEGGEVSVVVSDIFDDIVVARGADEGSSRATGEFTSPIVLSQSEIETLGLSDSGRLALIDGFTAGLSNLRSDQAACINAIQSYFKECSSLEEEIKNLKEGLENIDFAKKQIRELEEQQAKTNGNSEITQEYNRRLEHLGTQVSSLLVQEDVLQRFDEATSRWRENLSNLISEDYGTEAWDGAEESDPLKDLRKPYEEAIKKVADIASIFSSLASKSSAYLSEVEKKRALVEKESRDIRTELERATEGAGQIARQLAAIKANLAQMESRKKLLTERQTRLHSLREKRNEKITELVKIREERSSRREVAALNLSNSLSPHIRIEIERLSQYDAYTQSIADALRGSGMKYNELAQSISNNVSPNELLKFVEENDFATLASLASIPKDRAARLIGHLSENGIANIVTCQIDDNVHMCLLDGLEYKDITTLSAGQRCTVILSIVLQHKERTLIIDQPEDHLDNAFIASTVIKSLRERERGQVILSTHNANIPVLGNAALVIELTSDGRNGFIQVCKPLNAPEAVDAITNVMEGGKEAFQSRVKFYDEHEL